MYRPATQPCTLPCTLIQQLVTECTDRLLAKQPRTVTSTTGYSVLTGYTALYSSFNNWLQCTGRLPATQPCTLTSTTGYSVPTGYTALYSSFNNWLQCTGRVPATQPCTVLSTGYRVTDRLPVAQPALNSSLLISRLQAFLPYQPALGITNPKVSYQLTTPHQQPIHRAKTDDRPNNV